MSLDFFAEDDSNSDASILNTNIKWYFDALESNDLSNFKLSENDFEQLIEHFISIEDLENTEICSELAFSLYPYSQRLLVNWCDTLALLGKIDKTLEILDKYKESFAECGALYVVYARAYIKAAEFNKAAESYKKSVQYIEDKEDLYDLTYSLAMDCIEVNEFNSAIYYLDEIDSMKLNHHEYFNDYAYCFDKLENSKKAIEFYNKFLDAEPFNDMVWFNLGTMHAKELNYDEAIESYEYSIALNEKNDSSLFNLALVYINLSRFKEAVEQLLLCLELDNTSIDTYYSLAEAYIGLEDIALAKESYAKALEIDSSNEDSIASYKCILAIDEYLNNNIEEATNIIIELTKDNYDAISRMYKLYPNLANDSNFLDLLVKIKNSK